MESATFRKWLVEQGCRFDRHEHQQRHQGHVMVTETIEERRFLLAARMKRLMLAWFDALVRNWASTGRSFQGRRVGSDIDWQGAT
jgi:hypothetical protein